MRYHLGGAFVGGLLLGVGLMLVYVRQNPQSRQCMQALQTLAVQEERHRHRLGERTTTSSVSSSSSSSSYSTSSSRARTRVPIVEEDRESKGKHEKKARDQKRNKKKKKKNEEGEIEGESETPEDETDTRQRITHRAVQTIRPWQGGPATPDSPPNATRCDFAYVVYLTSCVYARMAAIAFEQLRAQPSKLCVDFVALVSQEFELKGKWWEDNGIIVRKVEAWKALSGDPTWKDSLTKLHVFGPQLYDYKRVVYFDVDTWVRKRPDELFAVEFTGDVKVAAPIAYWDTKHKDDGVVFVTTFLMVFEPSSKYWNTIQEAYSLNMHSSFDMDIINRLWSGRFTVIDPIYAANTGDLESAANPHYNSTLTQSPFIHFYSHPLLKPWKATSQSVADFIERKTVTPAGEKLFKDMYADIRAKYTMLKAKMLC